MGPYKQKINRDTVKNINNQILKNNSFRKEKHPFTVENLGSFKSFRGVREVIFGASVNNLQ